MECLPEGNYWGAPLDIGIAFKRLKLFDRAHTVFSRIYATNESNPDYLHNYAQTKITIANELAHKRNPPWSTVARLRKEAVELLRRAIPLSTDRAVQTAWCWFDMARTLNGLRYPRSQVQEAFENAINTLPYEKVFHEAYSRWRERQR